MTLNELRPFIPSKDYELSKSFYEALEFKGESAGEDLTIFTKDKCTFLLYRNTGDQAISHIMLQLIVKDINETYKLASEININEIKCSEVKQERWGKVFYLTGPSGELWHVTELNN